MFGKDPFDKSGFKGGMMHKGPGGPAGFKDGPAGQMPGWGKAPQAGGGGPQQGWGKAPPPGGIGQPQGGDPAFKVFKGAGPNDPGGKSMQGKAPGQYLSGMAQSRLTGMGMSPGGVRQLSAGQMPTAPNDQSILLSFLSSSLG